MRGDHERYEQLAVGHVLGGLEADEAADFRGHLLQCRDCRSRVAELRDLAADLAAAERDERARAQVATEVARRDDAPAAAPPGRIGVRHVTAAALAVIVVATAMGFWNLHLRTAVASYRQAAEYRQETLAILSTGVPVPVDTGEGVAAVVAVDGESLAFSVTGLPTLLPDERLELWLVHGGDGATRAGPPASAEAVAGGRVAGHVEVGDATAFVMTRERGGLGEWPRGAELVLAELVPEDDAAGSP